jgi:hypothetical protein
LANGLSAPQHSTYFVIFDDGLVREGIPPGVADLSKKIDKISIEKMKKRRKI